MVWFQLPGQAQGQGAKADTGTKVDNSNPFSGLKPPPKVTGAPAATPEGAAPAAAPVTPAPAVDAATKKDPKTGVTYDAEHPRASKETLEALIKEARAVTQDKQNIRYVKDLAGNQRYLDQDTAVQLKGYMPGQGIREDSHRAEIRARFEVLTEMGRFKNADEFLKHQESHGKKVTEANMQNWLTNAKNMPKVLAVTLPKKDTPPAPDVSGLQTENEDLKRKNGELATGKQEAEQRAAVAEQKVKDLQLQLDQAKAALKDAQAQLAASKQKEGELQASIIQLNAALAEAKGRNLTPEQRAAFIAQGKRLLEREEMGMPKREGDGSLKINPKSGLVETHRGIPGYKHDYAMKPLDERGKPQKDANGKDLQVIVPGADSLYRMYEAAEKDPKVDIAAILAAHTVLTHRHIDNLQKDQKTWQIGAWATGTILLAGSLIPGNSHVVSQGSGGGWSYGGGSSTGGGF